MARDFLGEPVSISNIFNGLKHTVAGLKNLQLKWNTDNLSANGQMLGFFTKASDSAGAADESVELNEKTVKLHAWMRRAASKVTVAFDGSNLKDGVSIRIKSVRIKNIPASCLLGAENKAGEGGSVSWVKHPDSHSETNPHSLFFYENRQGEGPDKSRRMKTETAFLTESPRKPNGSGYLPKDSIFFNLWDNSFWDGDDNVVKTIYDPCPAGYHVSSVYTFNGFTDSGQNIGLWDGSIDIKPNMYAATDENMMQEDDYKNGIFEFYTDRTKLISLGFPQNGYRDWDANAGIYTMNTIGQVWSAQTIPWPWGLANPYNAYYFKYSRNTFINPWNNFYATDGFPVRPAME